MKPILEASHINTFYGRSHILFDVSLSVAEGETVCLMGRNGAGKTTTFRTIAGLTPPHSGALVFKGRPCTRFASFKMARLGLGFVPEDRRILGPLSVLENLELGRIPGRKGHWTLGRVLEQFPVLKDMTHRMGGTLSGGEQQMLTIARALMGNPDLLVLDEPTEGLAPVIVAELRELIVRLKATETTILLSEQNIRFAMAVTDRIFIIDKGHIVYSGPVADFKGKTDLQKKYLSV
jgi:branched-chain amino acid transport system ATP-binding protein